MKKRFLALVAALALILIAITAIAEDGDFTIRKGLFNRAVVTGYSGKDSKINIPSEIDGFAIVEIADGAFEGLGFVREVKIPNSVTEIGKGAFKNCVNLNKVTLPSGIDVAEDAFYNTPYQISKYAFEHGIKLNSSAIAGDGEGGSTAATIIAIIIVIAAAVVYFYVLPNAKSKETENMEKSEENENENADGEDVNTENPKKNVSATFDAIRKAGAKIKLNAKSKIDTSGIASRENLRNASETPAAEAEKAPSEGDAEASNEAARENEDVSRENPNEGETVGE